MQNVDIYNLIRSEEIREYFRNNWKMSIEEKLCLVARSYEDAKKKSEMLNGLASQLNEIDSDLAIQMARYMEICYESIVQPEKDSLYIMNMVYSADVSDKDTLRLEELLETEEASDVYFTNFDDLISYVEVERDGNENVDWEACVEQICLPFRKKKYDCHNYSPDWRFRLAHINGGWAIRAFEKLSDDSEEVKYWFAKNGIGEEILEMATFMDFHELGHRFSLPFERGTKVKLQTPLMSEKLVGIFDSYYEGGEHHLYICAEDSFPAIDNSTNDNFLIVSYQLLSAYDSHTYCLWDWLERA